MHIYAKHARTHGGCPALRLRMTDCPQVRKASEDWLCFRSSLGRATLNIYIYICGYKCIYTIIQVYINIHSLMLRRCYIHRYIGIYECTHVFKHHSLFAVAEGNLPAPPAPLPPSSLPSAAVPASSASPAAAAVVVLLPRSEFLHLCGPDASNAFGWKKG